MIRPRVSVVTIFLNAEKFLAEAIESVLAQRFPSWELLLVDDGTTDRSTSIACSYADKYPQKVRYLEHEGHQNRGMSASRNLGIKSSQGDYLAFVDADDTWYPQALEEQVEILDAEPEAALVYGPLMVWYSWTGRADDQARDYMEKLGVTANQIIRPPALLPLFLQDLAAVPSGFLVRREVVNQVGGFEESFRGEYEDQAFCAKVCLQAPVYPADRCWYRYRQHTASSVSVGHSTGRTHEARRFFLDWLGDYLTEHQVKDGKIWRALKKEYRRFNQPKLFYFIRRNRHRFPWLGRI